MRRFEENKPCCTVCDAKKLCTVCGDKTLWACSDCQIDLRTTVYVCEKPACRDEHEHKIGSHWQLIQNSRAVSA